MPLFGNRRGDASAVGWSGRFAGGRARLVELPITVAHAQRAGTWPQTHRDPFDRMLAAQGAIEQVVLVSRAEARRRFGNQLVW